ncbi:acetyl-CoA decarbonylase/synthase complex subunit delta [Candidatus Bipolaricaulota bacterium]|nr:acetyl-CoA decarbonylase/synthase complex subunit delta [Candidatus Bipolaricaulota bacterium]
MTPQLPDTTRHWTRTIHAVTMGATSQDGGTRSSTVTIGGASVMPFHHFDGAMPHHPAVAMEITDVAPRDWPEALQVPIADVMDDPAAWGARVERDFAPDLVCLRLVGCDPNGANRTPEQAAETALAVRSATGLPLVVWGCGDLDKDAEVFPAVAEALAGERCLLGTITEKNYRTLTALGMAYGHSVIAESPVDINMAKQINILAMDAGFPEDRLVIYPTTGALGYGIEYVVSIMERLRLGGLGGDKLVAMPIVADIGREAWSAKEARATLEEAPTWGDPAKRGPAWETATALTYIHAGADLVILRHPDAVRDTKAAIEQLMVGSTSE